jgi:hypothetical protein
VNGGELPERTDHDRTQSKSILLVALVVVLTGRTAVRGFD